MIEDKLDLNNRRVEEIEAAIDKYIIGRHAERNRKLVKRRLIDGIVFEKLAEEFELSDSQVKRIVYKAVNRLVGKVPVYKAVSVVITIYHKLTRKLVAYIKNDTVLCSEDYEAVIEYTD